jgi:LPS sulfotransferase NodH
MCGAPAVREEGADMRHTNATDWQQTLAEVEQAVGHCLSALDRYEKAFDGVLRAEGVTPVAPALAAASGEQVAGWEERLGFARRHADAVETLLDEQEAEWSAWLAKYAAWRRSLEQPPT